MEPHNVKQYWFVAIVTPNTEKKAVDRMDDLVQYWKKQEILDETETVTAYVPIQKKVRYRPGTRKRVEVEEVLKVYEGRPNIVDRMINGDVALVINTASGKNTARDSKSIRHTAVSYGVPYCTTVAGAKASAIAIGKRREDTHVESLQEYYAREARG